MGRPSLRAAQRGKEHYKNRFADRPEKEEKGIVIGLAGRGKASSREKKKEDRSCRSKSPHPGEEKHPSAGESKKNRSRGKS